MSAHGPDLPVHAVDFVAELKARPNDRETLRWATERLREMTTRPAKIRWYDRLISMGVGFGVEFEIYQIATNLLALALLGINHIGVMLAIAAASVVIFPAAVAYWTGGGITFSLTGFAVRTSDGLPASRIRCAVRSIAAWAITLLGFSMYMMIVPILMERSGGSLGGGPGKPPSLGAEMFYAMMVNCGAALLMLIALFGIIYAIARPQRGIQDLIAGTRLVPK
jgi:hypothetical protein